MEIYLSPLAPETLVSRDGFGSPVPRQSTHLHTQARSGAYFWDSSRIPRRRLFIYFKPPYAIGSVPSLSGHPTACRWRSLPRVRRHRASKPQGTVAPNGCCLGRSPWINYYAPLFPHTHYWYEVGMLRVPAIILYQVQNGMFFISTDGIKGRYRTLEVMSRVLPPFSSRP